MSTTPTPSTEITANPSTQMVGGRCASDCSAFDGYAQAALTGLLANSALLTSLGMEAYVSNEEDKIPSKIVEAAMAYANLALKRRNDFMPNAKDHP